jgi:thioredoxin reductase (NADPH)
VVYLAWGCTPQHDLVRSLQAASDEHDVLRVNAHQETTVPRLYTAGDVVRGLNQVVVAASESAIAALPPLTFIEGFAVIKHVGVGGR